MCKRFEDELNEDIRLLVGVLELNEFVVLFDLACKAEELSKEKRKAEFEARDARKSQWSKRSRDLYARSSASAEYPNRDHGKQYPDSKAQTTSVAIVGNAKTGRPECHHCGKGMPSLWQTTPRNPGNGANNKSVPRDPTVRSDGRAPARTYAIRARKEASSPDVIIGTFSLYDTHVVALIDPESTHSYICMKLVSSMNMPVESTEFVIKVSNPLGKYVLVDKVCKNCPLMIRGHYFLANLMLLPFDEFDIILGMDWLTMHDVIVNCGRKIIKLKCESGDILRIGSDESNNLLVVISSMTAWKYIRKGCEAYLAFMLNTKGSELKNESVPVVCEYLDVFPEELTGLPPIREVEFGIDLIPVPHLFRLLRIGWLRQN
ncbi:zf-CCHC domain-containing protein/RVP_2 domain-containing protein [Gossypium australe]|uniref:Zf-CCHC domain-containing protein/RVP_2 domain-containing protein n=1 Tax=Gossypium australe TaxID=47621 RepID=A0A5B6WGV2_9ROSI|nr:zf-CCHC domain-containing protein/RVP_2 domain-containing protein [Gossypium australe]